MKTLNWNDMSSLGLIEKINTEILHPLGLSMSRDPETGVSQYIFVADDWFWEYYPTRNNTNISNEEIKERIKSMLNIK